MLPGTITKKWVPALSSHLHLQRSWLLVQGVGCSGEQEGKRRP